MTPRTDQQPLALQSADIGLRAWRALIESYSRLFAELDAEMRARHGLNLGDFDVLVHLDEAPGQRRRMCDLANAVLLSPSGLSRRVDRLQAAGLIQRERGAADARNVEASLTAAGKRRLRRLRETHRAGIKARFVDQFGEDELETLNQLLGRLVTPGARTADRG